MTNSAALAAARQRLQAGGIDDADLEAEVLLRHALSLDRAQFFAHLQDELDPEDEQRFDTYVHRRLQHEPSAYITGHREFFGLDLLVTPDTLIPRPDTEVLVEAAIEVAQAIPIEGRGLTVVDVGTGCGAIAIALAQALPQAEVYAIDQSAAALKVAEENARRLGQSRIIFWQGDILDAIPDNVDLIVANLPYIPSADIDGLEPEVRDFEPRAALDGGPDGLRLVEQLLQQAPRYLHPRGGLCLEFGDGQEGAVLMLAHRYLPKGMGRILRDLAGRPRCLVVSSWLALA